MLALFLIFIFIDIIATGFIYGFKYFIFAFIKRRGI